MRRATALLACAITGACLTDRGVGPEDTIAFVLESAAASGALFDEATAALATNGAIRSLRAAARRLVLVAESLDAVSGATFVLASATNPYAADPNRHDAPLGGTRFVLYGAAAQQSPPVLEDPLREIGFVDVFDVESSGAPLGVRAVIGGMEQISYQARVTVGDGASGLRPYDYVAELASPRQVAASGVMSGLSGLLAFTYADTVSDEGVDIFRWVDDRRHLSLAIGDRNRLDLDGHSFANIGHSDSDHYTSVTAQLWGLTGFEDFVTVRVRLGGIRGFLGISGISINGDSTLFQEGDCHFESRFTTCSRVQGDSVVSDTLDAFRAKVVQAGWTVTIRGYSSSEHAEALLAPAMFGARWRHRLAPGAPTSRDRREGEDSSRVKGDVR